MMLVAVWLSGNEVTLRQAGLVLWLVTILGCIVLVFSLASHPGQLSLVIPPWIVKMSTSDYYG